MFSIAHFYGNRTHSQVPGIKTRLYLWGGIIIQPTISNMLYPSLPLEQKVVTTSSACDNRKKLDHSCFAGGNVKWYDHSAKQVGSFL